MRKALYQVTIETERLSRSSRKTIIDKLGRIAAYREKAAAVWDISPEPGKVIRAYREQVRLLLGKADGKYSGYPASHLRITRRGVSEAYRMPLDPTTRANEGYSMAEAMRHLRQMLRQQRLRIKEEMQLDPSRVVRDPHTGTNVRLFYVRREPGYWINRLYEKRFNDPKVPKTADLYNGIEIECFVPDMRVLRERLLPFAQYVNLGTDGSINPPSGYTGAEVRVLLKRDEVPTLAPAILRAIRQAGGKVNASCGLHVHFDMRERPLEEVTKCYKKLYHCQSVLFGMIPKTRRSNRFCERNRSSDMAVDYNSDYRYRAINPCAYRRYKTLEVRLHSGTLDDVKVVNWIDLIWRIIEGPPDIQRASRSLDNFGKRFKLPPYLVSYVKERTAKFATPDTNNAALRDDALAAAEAAEYADQPAEPGAPVPAEAGTTGIPRRYACCDRMVSGGHRTTCPVGRRGVITVASVDDAPF